MNTTKERQAIHNPEETVRLFYPVIAPLIMCSGVGDGKTTSCVMAQAATIDALRRGETLAKPTDDMTCACRLLRRMAIRANDANWWKDDAERTEHLRPLIPFLLDSKVDEETTWKRIFFVVDKTVRELTPMRLEFIAAHTKNEKLKADIANGIEELKSIPQIVDKASCKAARGACQKLRASASADADADAYAYAYAYASAYADADADASAYADADAYAYASAYASASAYADADAYAYAYASAYADADAYASASADADAYAYAQKIKYRTSYLQLFRDVAAII